MRTVNPVIIDMTEMQKRLAQAERERNAARAEENTWRERWVKDVREMQRQRDAALAKVVETERENERLQELATGLASENKATVWGIEAARLRAERDAALAKARAAERLRVEGKHNLELVSDALTNLRALIEALAVKYETRWPHEEGFPADLRALLQPRKEETALDVLSRIESLMHPHPIARDAQILREDLAKLRALLEHAQGARGLQKGAILQEIEKHSALEDGLEESNYNGDRIQRIKDALEI